MSESVRSRSVSAVVLGDGGRVVLLHRRGDVPLWSLPGGGVEPGEDWEAAAIREVREETGYEVALDRLVGEYVRPQIGDTKHLFVGRVIGGGPQVVPPESVGLGWFPVDRLPLNHLPWHGEYVAEAIADCPALVKKTQMQACWQVMAMRGLYVLADLRDLLPRRP